MTGDQWLRLIAMLGAALAVGGTVQMIRHRRSPLLALAILLLSLSTVAEHVTRWAKPVPTWATLLDIAGFVALGVYLADQRRRWLDRRGQ